MGIIKAIGSAIGGGLADSWLEVMEADQMKATTVMTRGVMVRKNDRRLGNKKGTEDYISDGSIIHVYSNQCMLLIDGGKIVDYTVEEGYYKVDSGSAPSMFGGKFGDALKETFDRIRYAGVTSGKQIVVFINLQEIKGIKFGTKNPINYFDNFYNSELFLRAHGTYSIKITDPLKFYAEVVDKSAKRHEIEDINEQYLSEFLEALQSVINQMSSEGIRISHVTGKAQEVSRYMRDALDNDWRDMRGMEIQSVGIASISYDEDSRKLINLRNQGAMMSDPNVREGYVQTTVAEGLKAAGSNSNGSAAAFMGMGVGMNAAGNFMGSVSSYNAQQAAQQAGQQGKPAGGWVCTCGATNTGKFCSECGKKQPAAKASWTCSCGATNTGKFCSECGQPKPAEWVCPECGTKNAPNAKFCSNCGAKKA